jgi:hypothetical protein
VQIKSRSAHDLEYIGRGGLLLLRLGKMVPSLDELAPAFVELRF